MSWLTKQQKEDLYRLITGLSKEDACIIFDEFDNIKCARLNDCMKTIEIKMTVEPVKGVLD